MFEKYLIPLLVAKELGSIPGKTRMQKLVRLIEAELDKQRVIRLNYGYKLYHHGPFSFQLARIAETLVEGDYLSERGKITPDGNMLHIYHLTKKGRNLLKEAKKKKIIGNNIANVVSTISKKYGYMTLPELVDEAYETM